MAGLWPNGMMFSGALLEGVHHTVPPDCFVGRRCRDATDVPSASALHTNLPETLTIDNRMSVSVSCRDRLGAHAAPCILGWRL
jgi:hypothetical protein